MKKFLDDFTFRRLALLGTLAMLATFALAETSAIKGAVIDDATRRPLSGVNVLVEGTGLGATTDERGEYFIGGLRETTYVVKASRVGYATQRFRTVLGEGATQIDFTLRVLEILGEPIVVTATRGRPGETPETNSTLDKRTIRERYTTQDIPILLSELPSITTYSEAGNGIGYTYLNIRGFDARRVAVMVNGIPQNDPEDHNVYWLDMPDIASSVEDIQVQRGAGSAFYGPPAIGGSVNLVTNNFGRERSLQLSAGVGGFNTRRYAASFSSGLIDNQYAIHGKLAHILSDGYREKSWVDFSSYFLGVIRYDEDMTTQINFYGGPVADGLAYYGNPKAFVKDRTLRKKNFSYWEPGYFIERRRDEIENFSQPHYELFHEWRLSDSLALNNTLFLVFGDGFFDYDGSWAPYSYYRITRENGFNFTGDPDALYFPNALIHAVASNKQWGWLPRITVKHDNGEFIAGAELRIHRSDHWGSLKRADAIPVSIPENYRYYEYKGAKDILSLYAQELYRFTPAVTGLVSLQYAYNRYRVYREKYLGTDFSMPYHFINPRIGVNYNFDRNWSSYLSAAFTSREPRLKNLYDAAESSGGSTPQFAAANAGQFDFSSPLVKPERLFDIEVGGAFSTENAHVNANLFWMGFSDEIVKSGQVDRFGQPITGNAERTRHVGVELGGRVAVAEGLEFRANTTISRNRFVRHTEYVKQTNPTTGQREVVPMNVKGNPIAGFPDFMANASLTYRAANLVLYLSGKYVGKQYTDNFKDEENTVDPYFVSDASASYKFECLPGNTSLELKLQVNNLFDRLYAAYGEGNQFFVGAERNVFFNVAFNL
ncbi:MAG: TonB-dependent receptor [Ignavibacteriae bacterium]|nr:TonB-dependent receptor [Ignavibacteriota bacterium]